MKRISWVLLLFAAVIVFQANSLHAAAPIPSQTPTPTPVGHPPTGGGCVGCKKPWPFGGHPNLVEAEGTISKFDPEQEDVRHLEIPGVSPGESRIASVRVEIRSRAGKLLFQTSKASAKVVETGVLIDLPVEIAKTGKRYFQPGNKLRILLNIRQPVPPKNGKGEEHK